MSRDIGLLVMVCTETRPENQRKMPSIALFPNGLGERTTMLTKMEHLLN